MQNDKLRDVLTETIEDILKTRANAAPKGVSILLPEIAIGKPGKLADTLIVGGCGILSGRIEARTLVAHQDPFPYVEADPGKWDVRFMTMADMVRHWSKDPSTKVGAVLVQDRKIIGTGYNGFPPRTPDHEEIYADRKRKYPRILHAERNAIDNSTANVRGSTIYVTARPCCACMAQLISAGVRRVVYRTSEDYEERWKEDGAEAMSLARDAGIGLVRYAPEFEA